MVEPIDWSASKVSRIETGSRTVNVSGGAERWTLPVTSAPTSPGLSSQVRATLPRLRSPIDPVPPLATKNQSSLYKFGKTVLHDGESVLASEAGSSQ